MNDGRVTYHPASPSGSGMLIVVVGAVVSPSPPPGSHVSSSPRVKKSKLATMPAPPAWLAADSRPIRGSEMSARL